MATARFQYVFIPMQDQPPLAKLTDAYALMEKEYQAARSARNNAVRTAEDVKSAVRHPNRGRETQLRECLPAAHLAAVREQAVKEPLMKAIAQFQGVIAEVRMCVNDAEGWPSWQYDGLRINLHCAVELLQNAIQTLGSIPPYDLNNVSLTLDNDFWRAIDMFLATPAMPPLGTKHWKYCTHWTPEWELLVLCLTAAQSSGMNGETILLEVPGSCQSPSTIQSVCESLRKRNWKITEIGSPLVVTLQMTPPKVRK